MHERSAAATLLTMAASGLVLAGCADNSATTSPSASAGAPTASTPAASAGAGGAVASCVAGNWHSTTVSGHAASGGATANLSGGGGVAVTIGPNGETAIDFSKMQPVDFTTKVAGADVTGKFTFAGKVSATVQTGNASGSTTTSAGPTTSASPVAGASPTPAGSASPATGVSPAASASAGGASATEGTWEPQPPINWGETRVTVDLTTPVKVRPVDNQRVADYAGDGASRTGNVVDIQPLLGKGTYQCQGDSLIIMPDAGGLGWTLTRA